VGVWGGRGEWLAVRRRSSGTDDDTRGGSSSVGGSETIRKANSKNGKPLTKEKIQERTG